MEEIRDTHRLESSSSTKLINELKDQLSKSETSLSSQASQQIEIAHLRADLSKAQTQAKEEEEKRSKAISLLKTVRQKLVKLEKEKDEAEKLKDGDRQERQRMVENLEKLRGEREREVSNLRAGFEKEAASLRDKYERDVAAKKAQWELDIITSKASHAKEIANKVSRISTLEASVKELQNARQEQFQLLQTTQDEAEQHKAELEAREASLKEQAFQLKEALDRISILEEEIATSKRGGPLDISTASHGGRTSPSEVTGGISPADLSRLLAEAQAKAELKLSELRSEVARSERDRLDSEEESSRHLQDRARELERLRAVIREKDTEYAEAVRGRRERDEQISQVEERELSLRLRIADLQDQVEKLDMEKSRALDLEVGDSRCL
jgi:chromosome segregation ATPase